MEPKKRNYAYEAQKRIADKLFQNPHKIVEIEKTINSLANKTTDPPDFVRNVMGSSAGAGSGEFHIYRHLRRKEMTRMKNMEKSAEEEIADEEFRKKLEENARISEELTRKKRLKREKKKLNKRLKNSKSAEQSTIKDQSQSET